jgi:hypothetical protein
MVSDLVKLLFLHSNSSYDMNKKQHPLRGILKHIDAMEEKGSNAVSALLDSIMYNTVLR